jgi:hypothetical protein
MNGPSSSQQRGSLFDHLIGSRKQFVWDGESERFGGLEIDDQLKLYRRLHGVRLDQIAALARRYSVPATFQFREFAAAGGLMSYGPGFGESFRQAGILAGRILNGEKPADLPVMQPTKFELVINMKTAKALGIEVPISMQMLADEVIE